MSRSIHLAETVSTNSYLYDLLTKQRLDEYTTVYTDFQTAGKGQRGNYWESAKGENILCSVLLYPTSIEASEQFIISQFVSIAIKNVLNKYTDNISIKWPNDIYWKDKKICGILIENYLIDNSISQSIIGIGININQIFFTTNAPNPGSLQLITNTKHNCEQIRLEIVESIKDYHNRIQLGEKQYIIQHYKASLFRYNNDLHPFCDKNGNFMARIKDVSVSGILSLETEAGELREYAFKEIRFCL